MKTTTATTLIEVLCDCPYCDELMDIIDRDDVKGSLNDKPRVSNCDIEITCENCQGIFLVTDIEY